MSQGYRSLLAPWMGGASSPPIPHGGYRSLLAFWGGGAFGSPPVTLPSGGGGGYARQVIHRQAPDDAEEIFLMMVNAFMRTQ